MRRRAILFPALLSALALTAGRAGADPIERLEFRSDDGEPLPAGAVGRIAARGPSVMAGYLGAGGAPIPGDPIRDGCDDLVAAVESLQKSRQTAAGITA
jgi:acyl-CoA synthetase (AMP-forming)/AMP-acid ligase II